MSSSQQILPVVMVDDNEADLFIVQSCLERSNLAHPFRAFSGGTAFLEYLTQVKAQREPVPLLALLDINMPVMNGFELFDHVREDRSFDDLPVFMMVTSSNDEGDREEASKQARH